jgi:hypothetical protein
MEDILSEANSKLNRVKKIGTVNPVDDFRIFAEKLLKLFPQSNQSQEGDDDDLQGDFENLCVQIQTRIQDLMSESLLQLNSGDRITAISYQSKAFECIKIQREYCIKFSCVEQFNSYLKTFKSYLLNESTKSSHKHAQELISFWNKYFIECQCSLITKLDCDSSEFTIENSQQFLSSFTESLMQQQQSDTQYTQVKNEQAENMEDLLDMM